MTLAGLVEVTLGVCVAGWKGVGVRVALGLSVTIRNVMGVNVSVTDTAGRMGRLQAIVEKRRVMRTMMIFTARMLASNKNQGDV